MFLHLDSFCLTSQFTSILLYCTIWHSSFWNSSSWVLSILSEPGTVLSLILKKKCLLYCKNRNRMPLRFQYIYFIFLILYILYMLHKILEKINLKHTHRKHGQNYFLWSYLQDNILLWSFWCLTISHRGSAPCLWHSQESTDCTAQDGISRTLCLSRV